MVVKMMTAEGKKPQDQLEKALIQEAQNLSALYTVLTAHQQLDDLDEMMNLALDQVLLISVSHAGSIHLLEKEHDHLHLAAHKGMREYVVKEIGQNPNYNEFLGRIIALRKSLYITDFSKELTLGKVFKIGGWQVFLGIPIMSASRNWGILVIFGDKNLHGISDELKLLEMIAGQIGIALENRLLRKQNEQLIIIEERNRLARELHDSVTQSLYSLTLFAKTASRMMKAGEIEETQRCLNEINVSSLQALKEMRLLVHKLRPRSNEEIGLINSLEQRLKAVEGRSGVKYELKVDGDISFPPDVENELYAVSVEALNNALKHARADQVQVVMHREGNNVSMEISDNGVGFDEDQAKLSGGLGLASMEERIRKIKGEIHLDSTPGVGTIIRLQVPVA